MNNEMKKHMIRSALVMANSYNLNNDTDSFAYLIVTEDDYEITYNTDSAETNPDDWYDDAGFSLKDLIENDEAKFTHIAIQLSSHQFEKRC